MKLYKAHGSKTLYLVKSGEVYFYSIMREKFMPTTRSLTNLLNIAELVGNNFKATNPKHEAFKHVHIANSKADYS